MDYECPYCGWELEYHDYYGRICAHQDGFVAGQIYKCHNEECGSECFNFHFHNLSGYGDYELREGYPC